MLYWSHKGKFHPKSQQDYKHMKPWTHKWRHTCSCTEGEVAASESAGPDRHPAHLGVGFLAQGYFNIVLYLCCYHRTFQFLLELGTPDRLTWTKPRGLKQEYLLNRVQWWSGENFLLLNKLPPCTMQPSAWNVDLSSVNFIQPVILCGCCAVQLGYNFTTILEGTLKMPPYNRKNRKKNPERHPHARSICKIAMVSVSVL